MAVAWSKPKAPPPWDGAIRCALALCSTGSEVNTAPVTDGLDLRQLTAVQAHVETAIAAFGTIFVKGLLPGDTVTVDGTVFTAVAPDFGPVTNVQFRVGSALGPDRGQDYITAGNLAAAIAANPATSVNLTASVASDEPIVTVTALVDGAGGNARALATSAAARAVLSGATLAGGAAAAAFAAGAALLAYLLNPITGRWNRAPDLDLPLQAGVSNQSLLPVSVKAQTGRLQLLPNLVGQPCAVYMNGLAGRIP